MMLPNVRLLIVALLVGLATPAITGCRGAPGKPAPGSEIARPDQVTDFATLYAQNCAACHGVSGKNGAAISLANPVYLAVAGAANIERITANGVPGTAMPPFGKAAGGMLTGQQIMMLATGMESTWGNSATFAGQAPPPYASSGLGNPVQGEKEFATFCARCHGANGTGMSATGTVTGSLVDPAYLALISDQGLRSILIAGQTEQGAHDWRSYLSGPAARPLAAEEISNIVAWLTSHRIAAPGQPYQQHP